MSKTYKFCKICGKEYEYCYTERKGLYRWQEVACCPEHGAEYFRLVEEARTMDAEESSDVNVAENYKEAEENDVTRLASSEDLIIDSDEAIEADDPDAEEG